MIGQAAQFRQDKFKIIHPPLEDWLKRQITDERLRDSLFVYKANLWGTYVIARWKQKGRFFVDVMNLGTSLNNFTRRQARYLLLLLLHPQSGSAISKQLKESQRDFLRERQEQEELQKVERDRTLRMTGFA